MDIPLPDSPLQLSGISSNSVPAAAQPSNSIAGVSLPVAMATFVGVASISFVLAACFLCLSLQQCVLFAQHKLSNNKINNKNSNAKNNNCQSSAIQRSTTSEQVIETKKQEIETVTISDTTDKAGGDTETHRLSNENKPEVPKTSQQVRRESQSVSPSGNEDNAIDSHIYEAVEYVALPTAATAADADAANDLSANNNHNNNSKDSNENEDTKLEDNGSKSEVSELAKS